MFEQFINPQFNFDKTRGTVSNNIMFHCRRNNIGSMLVLVLIATSLFLVILLGSLSLAVMQQKLNIRKVARAQALHIAEAGVNYYRWVLYHDHEEYCNKEACLGPPDYGPYGPYAYTDSGGEGIVGYYELYIIPPPIDGSTVVTIKSVGWTADFPQIKRSIEVGCGIPSWTTYATMTNGADADLGYGSGSEVWGPVHCNYGLVRMDGIAHHLVTSSQPGRGTRFGVYTCRDVEPYRGTGGCDPAWDGNDPPQNLPDPDRPNFLGGRDMGSHIPIISYDSSVGGQYMSDVYAKATSSEGLLFDPANAGAADPDSEPAYWGCLSSGTCQEGFHIILKTNNKFDIREVSAVRPNIGSVPSRTIQSESAPTEYDIPVSGIVFVKHTVWVSGHVDNGASGTRVTILAFKDPIDGSNDAEIRITNDITYSNYDGTDAIGLIAQNNVAIGYYCEDDLRIDAALLAKYGRRFCQDSDTYKTLLTIYGQTASYLKPYTSGCFATRHYIYDNNLTFAPPPHYPTTGQYTFISWKEE